MAATISFVRDGLPSAMELKMNQGAPIHTPPSISAIHGQNGLTTHAPHGLPRGSSTIRYSSSLGIPHPFPCCSNHRSTSSYCPDSFA